MLCGHLPSCSSPRAERSGQGKGSGSGGAFGNPGALGALGILTQGRPAARRGGPGRMRAPLLFFGLSGDPDAIFGKALCVQASAALSEESAER